MSTFTTDEDDTRAGPLSAKLALALDASLSELNRLADEATTEPQTMLVIDLLRPDVTGADVAAPLKGTGRTVDVVVTVGTKAVTRTERRDDRYDLDLNLSLAGLDEYEARSVKRLLTQHLRALVATARHENSEERVTQLLRAVAPPDPLAEVELKIAEATVDLRREFLERVPVLTSAQLHERAGFPGSNPSQTGLRWRKQGKLFSINHGGRELYPAFQLGPDGRPLPIAAELLEILARDPDRTEWDNALWFAGESGWLDGKTPMELLQSEPALVKQAAEQEVLRDES
jgi:hypothetical protein